MTRRRTLEAHDATDADARGNNPWCVDGALIGRATGGSDGFRVGRALALVKPALAEIGATAEMDILGTSTGPR